MHRDGPAGSASDAGQCELGPSVRRVERHEDEATRLALGEDLTARVGAGRPSPRRGTWHIMSPTAMWAPCEVNETTVPSTVLPTGWSATKVRKVIGSLIALDPAAVAPSSTGAPPLPLLAVFAAEDPLPAFLALALVPAALPATVFFADLEPAAFSAPGFWVAAFLGAAMAFAFFPRFFAPFEATSRAAPLVFVVFDAFTTGTALEGFDALVALVGLTAALTAFTTALTAFEAFVFFFALAGFAALVTLVTLVGGASAAFAGFAVWVSLAFFAFLAAFSDLAWLAVGWSDLARSGLAWSGLAWSSLAAFGDLSALVAGRLRPLPVDPVEAPFSASDLLFTAARLFGPRTGVRGVKTHPTPGTGFPPISRPGSNSHGRSAWNSWNESFERTSAPAFSAMRRMKPSPRPTAPAGGVSISPCSSACSKAGRSEGSIR